MAHVIAHHGSERVSKGMLINMGGGTVRRSGQGCRRGVSYDAIMQIYGIGTTVGVELPYRAPRSRRPII